MLDPLTQRKIPTEFCQKAQGCAAALPWVNVNPEGIYPNGFRHLCLIFRFRSNGNASNAQPPFGYLSPELSGEDDAPTQCQHQARQLSLLAFSPGDKSKNRV